MNEREKERRKESKETNNKTLEFYLSAKIFIFTIKIKKYVF
jgi:hypothetical protein